MKHVVLLLAAALPCAADACQISISGILPQGRIAGFTLASNHASLQAARVHPGWTMSMTNDPSWRVNAVGHAVIGAAFLSREEFLSMFSFQPEPGFSCQSLQAAHATRIGMEIYAQDGTKKFKLDDLSVIFDLR